MRGGLSCTKLVTSLIHEAGRRIACNNCELSIIYVFSLSLQTNKRTKKPQGGKEKD